MEEVGVRLRFEGKSIRLGDEVIDEERKWKPTWQIVKSCLQKAMESSRIENYKTKEQESQFHQEQEDKCHLWWAKLTRKEDILNYDNARTNGDKIVECSERIGSRRML